MSRPQSLQTFTDYSWFTDFRLKEFATKADLVVDFLRDASASTAQRLNARGYSDEEIFHSKTDLTLTASGENSETYEITGINPGSRKLVSVCALLFEDGDPVAVNGKDFTPFAWLWVRGLDITASTAATFAIESVEKVIDFASTSGSFRVGMDMADGLTGETFAGIRVADSESAFTYTAKTGTEFNIDYTAPNTEYELRIERRATDGTVTHHSSTRVWSPGPSAGAIRSFRIFSSEGGSLADVVRFRYDPPVGEGQSDRPPLLFYKEEDDSTAQLNTEFVRLTTDGAGSGYKSGEIYSAAQGVTTASITRWMQAHFRGKYYMCRLNATGSDGGQACDWVNNGIEEGRRSDIDNIRFTEFYADRLTVAWTRSSRVESLRVRVNHAGISTDYNPTVNTITVTGLSASTTISMSFWVTAGGAERNPSEALISAYMPPSLPPHAAPEDLRSTLVTNSRINAVWDLPEAKGGTRQVTRVELRLLRDGSRVTTSILPVDAELASITTLTQLTTYTLQVLLVTAAGDGPVAEFTFTTPSEFTYSIGNTRYIEFSDRDAEGINRAHYTARKRSPFRIAESPFGASMRTTKATSFRRPWRLKRRGLSNGSNRENLLLLRWFGRNRAMWGTLT